MFEDKAVRDALARDGEPPFPAFVEYFQPNLRSLKEVFDHVEDIYRVVKFKPLDMSASQVAAVVGFYCIPVKGRTTDGSMVPMLRRYGLRPALYEEMLGFARRYPDAQLKQNIVALGSRATIIDQPYVNHPHPCHCAFVSMMGALDGTRRHLFLAQNIWDDYEYDDCTFLAVRSRNA